MEQQKFTRKNVQIYEAQRRQDNKRKRRIIFYVCLFIAVTLVFLTVCAAVFLKVKNIQIKGNEKYADDELRECIPLELGKNIFMFNARDIEMDIVNKYPYIESVEIKRDLPSTVLVNVNEANPCFYSQIAGSYYYLSENLMVLEKLTEAIPTETTLKALQLNNVKRCIVGDDIEFVDKRTFDAIIELRQILIEYGMDTSVINIDIRSRFDIYFNYDNRFKVYLGDMENAEVKISFLVGILNELGSSETGTIDISNPQEASVALS